MDIDLLDLRETILEYSGKQMDHGLDQEAADFQALMSLPRELRDHGIWALWSPDYTEVRSLDLSRLLGVSPGRIALPPGYSGAVLAYRKFVVYRNGRILGVSTCNPFQSIQGKS